MRDTRVLALLALAAALWAAPAQAELNFNLGGELKMRYRYNFADSANYPGFQFYEAELFADGDLSDYSSFIIEYNLMHENKPEPENVWIDLHAPLKPAFSHGGFGLRIGHFQAPFGYENDDNEGYMYGGRSSINVSLMHSERIDGWRLRDREIGICGALSLGPVTLWPGVYNGNGTWLNYGGSDNERLKFDAGVKGQVRLGELEFGGAFLSAPGTDSSTASYKKLRKASDYVHTRDISRIGGHIKFPASGLPLGADENLGGKPFVIWGEFMAGQNKAVFAWDTLWTHDTQKTLAAFLEVNAVVVPGKLGAFVRADYYDPDREIEKNETVGLTPGLSCFLWSRVKLTGQYEFYSNNDKNGALAYQDRIATEVGVTF